jgi:hypothetical protein
MKLFGSLTELVSAIFRKDSQTVTLRPNQSVTYTAARDIQTPAQDADSVLVSRTSTDTLTNKTISGAANTLTVRAASDITGTLPVLNGGTGTTTSTGTGSTVLSASPTLTGTPVLATPTATSASITGTGGAGFLELAEQSAAPSNPAATKLRVYGKTTDEGLYFLNSSGTEKQVGSGSGEKNYVSTGSSTAASWTASGAGITVATDVTGSELPRPNTTATGIKTTGVSGSTAYAYYRFILDDADASKKLKVQFDMKPITGYVASDFKVDVYSNTASDYTTGNTRLALSTDSSAVSALPALTGTYRTTFDAPAVSAKYIEVRIGLNGTNTHALVASDIVVGPGVVQQGAAATGWTAFTPTIGTTAATSSNSSYWRRVGDTIEINGYVAFSGTGTGGVTVSLPAGLTINTGTLGGAGSPIASTVNGDGWWYNTTTTQVIHLNYSSATSVVFIKPATATTQLNGTDLAASHQIGYNFKVGVNEWAGSGTVNVVQNDVEYAWNSSTSTTSDSTSFGYGPSGVAGTAFAPAGTATVLKRVRFQTPIQATDLVELQFKLGNAWVSAPDSDRSFATNDAGTTFYGALLSPGGTAATDMDVTFCSQRTPGGAWSASDVWRVRKVSGGQAVGFSEVNPGVSSGLVSANGLKGVATNSTASAGYVGEYIENYRSTSTANITSAVYTSVDTGNTSFNDGNEVGITLTPGDWDITGLVWFICTGGAAITDQIAGIGTGKGTSSTGLVLGLNAIENNVNMLANAYVSINLPTWRVLISTTTTYYLKAQCSFASGTVACRGILRARRMR